MKSEKTRLQKRADERWSLLVRQRDKICRLCKTRPSKDAHHIFGRAHKATRFDILNGLGLCFRCHQPDGHGDPCNFHEKIVAEIGIDLYETLRADHLRQVKYNEAYIKEWLSILQTKTPL